jgi:hypothetical protein
MVGVADIYFLLYIFVDSLRNTLTIFISIQPFNTPHI